MSPFFALKYGPPAMAKTTSKGNYPNAAPKDQKYGSIIVVSSVASTYGGELQDEATRRNNHCITFFTVDPDKKAKQAAGVPATP